MTDETAGNTRYRWAVLTALLFGTATYSANLIFMAPILPQVAQDLHINMGAAANLFTAYLLTCAISQMFAGVVCDKLGVTAALVVGSLCASVPAVLMPWLGDNYNAVVVMRLIQGASTGFIVTSTGPVLALWFPEKERGLASGLAVGSSSTGCALAVVLSPIIYATAGTWQRTSAVFSIIGWIGLLLALMWTRRKPPVAVETLCPTAATASPAKMTVREIALSPVTWVATFCVFFGNFGLHPLLNFVPAYLAAPAPAGLGFGSMLAGRMALATTIVGIFATSSSGIFYDKVAKGDARLPIALGFIMTGLFAYGLVCSLVYSSMFSIVICLMLAGWGGMFIYPAINAYVIANFPPGIVGRMLGICFGLGGFGGFIGLYLGGLSISRSGNFVMAIILISLASAAGIIVAFFAGQRTKKTL